MSEKPVPIEPDASQNAAQAVARLAHEHAAGLYTLGLRFCGDPTKAEDLVQEVFLNALKGWAGFEGRSDPKTWLYTIAARACKRMHRTRSGEPSSIGSLDALLPFDEPLVARVEDGGPLGEQVRREARERLEASIVGLPEEFRVPLVLKEIAGFSMPEVAQILGLEEGTVRSRVHRSRLKLRKAIEGALPKGESPPPAYPEQTCMDLLNAKQSALDRGVPFDTSVVCERCRSVFETLDLTKEICRDLAAGQLPEGVRERLAAKLA